MPAPRTPSPSAARSARPRSVPAPATPPPRVVIEAVHPRVDGGRFPIKRVVGETVAVRADLFADGHDVIAAVLRYRAREHADPTHEGDWREVAMRPLGNDLWEAGFEVDRLAVYEYTIQGWVDRFATWRDGLAKKVDAGLDVATELQEGALLVRAALERSGADPATSPLARATRALEEDAGAAARIDDALSEELAELMRRHDDRPAAVTLDPPLQVLVERERARTGAWYEMFPRSYSPEPGRSATFAEAALRLPGIAEMGFDVVYLPPIHPIGTTFRKGANNSLSPAPGDPGSPWAIGSEEGGHDAVEPGLGTIEDFDQFVAVARNLGLDVALDLAYQTSPDHPYVREHPEWFRHRPDGSIKYAENPPKKYQDIYPLDFESPDWRALWEELKRVVLFWIDHGVTIFRVDNPHTKAFRFWEWMIADVRREHPGVVFLSEAFTRPKVMRHLAKLGFSQSYTYFTWRNTKAELTEYFTELTQTDVREYMRPNLFVNTPDILHEYLQRGGPPAFRVRLLLAATLGASYGIYSGFEVCEHRAVRPGSEEYLDSEKYQFRHWDWTTPGHLRELIARINGIRRSHPALQSDWGLRFHATDNEHLLCYSKRSPDGGDALLVVVNLDPHEMRHGWIQVPVADWPPLASMAPGLGYAAHDLLSGETYYWMGEWNYVRLDPGLSPGHVVLLTSR